MGISSEISAARNGKRSAAVSVGICEPSMRDHLQLTKATWLATSDWTPCHFFVSFHDIYNLDGISRCRVDVSRWC